jgi:hypothetical protein
MVAIVILAALAMKQKCAIGSLTVRYLTQERIRTISFIVLRPRAVFFANLLHFYLAAVPRTAA